MEASTITRAPARIVPLHRSQRGYVLLAARAVLLPVCVAVLGQNLATVHHWSTRTWIASVVLALYVLGAFVELARSFGPTDVALVDGDLVVACPTLLRSPVRIAREQVAWAAVTPHGWCACRGWSPYRDGQTAAVTPDRPYLGASIRMVVTLDEPVLPAWRRIPLGKRDVVHGRSMPRRARTLVFTAAERDVAPLRALLDDFLGAPGEVLEISNQDRRRDIAVTCARLAAATCALVAFAAIPSAHSDPLRALRPGVCLDAPDGTAFDSVVVQPCTTPHSAEVVGTTHHADVAAMSANDCASEYARYAGTGSDQYGVQVQVVRDRGSAEGVCVAVLPTFVTWSLRTTSGTTL